ncbi:MAG: SGNH/GDSL hydrolase family protein [Treponema sp.]|jgi:lysophospholipase L1-like esterase|nr:SGNH/GDSL hydrolase family protein [Treponema sp.]
MKTILCYGDSNTWGFDPRSMSRYDHKTRWPMVLGRTLNAGADPDDPPYWIVEEGLNGRTSCREDPVEGDKNGFRQLMPILESHAPVDIFIVMLGTNDLKLRFNPQPYDIAHGVQRIAGAVRDSRQGPGGTSPKVIMICPPATAVLSPLFKNFFGDPVELSREFPPHYKACAQEAGALFLDAGKHVITSPADGIHFDAEGQIALGKAAAELIRRMA